MKLNELMLACADKCFLKVYGLEDKHNVNFIDENWFNSNSYTYLANHYPDIMNYNVLMFYYSTDERGVPTLHVNVYKE